MTTAFLFRLPLAALALSLLAATAPAWAHHHIVDEDHAPHGSWADAPPAHRHANTNTKARAVPAPAKAAAAPRQVRVVMSDAMRFTPSEIVLKRGETVRFVAANEGQVLHEMVIGTRGDIARLRALQKTDPHAVHAQPVPMVHVEPGSSGDIVWRAAEAGSFVVACLLPGHYEAGMVGAIRVTP
jgi:uncharacterized cupredoxin-like copper-binding protein